jgi:hypothetical protein
MHMDFGIYSNHMPFINNRPVGRNLIVGIRAIGLKGNLTKQKLTILSVTQKFYSPIILRPRPTVLVRSGCLRETFRRSAMCLGNLNFD